MHPTEAARIAREKGCEPVVIPAGKYVFVSDSPTGERTLVERRQIAEDSVLLYKPDNYMDIFLAFREWMNKTWDNQSTEVQVAAMEMSPEQKKNAIYSWWRNGRDWKAAYDAFGINSVPLTDLEPDNVSVIVEE